MRLQKLDGLKPSSSLLAYIKGGAGEAVREVVEEASFPPSCRNVNAASVKKTRRLKAVKFAFAHEMAIGGVLDRPYFPRDSDQLENNSRLVPA
jgi:hypothetical protein